MTKLINLIFDQEAKTKSIGPLKSETLFLLPDFT